MIPPLDVALVNKKTAAVASGGGGGGGDDDDDDDDNLPAPRAMSVMDLMRNRRQGAAAATLEPEPVSYTHLTLPTIPLV